jgi:hypothetical protein
MAPGSALSRALAHAKRAIKEPVVSAVYRITMLEAIKTGVPEHDELLAFHLLDEQDVAVLNEQEELFEAISEEVERSFNDQVLPRFRQMVTEHSRVERLGGIMRAVFKAMATPALDAGYFARKAGIGTVHDGIDLPVEAFTGSYLSFHRIAVPALVRRYGATRRRSRGC